MFTLSKVLSHRRLDLILVAHTDPKEIELVRKIFYTMGFNTFGATYDRIEYMIESRHIDAILFVDIYSPDRVVPICRDLKVKYPRIPIVVAARDECESELAEMLWLCCDKVISYSVKSTVAALAIIECVERQSGKPYGDLHANGFRLPLRSKDAAFDELNLELTQNERMIIRCLLLGHPMHVSPEYLSECCAYPGTDPSQYNLSAYIHAINQKTIELMDAKIIHFTVGLGYAFKYKHKPCKTISVRQRLYNFIRRRQRNAPKYK